jgi:hypothetical protein
MLPPTRIFPSVCKAMHWKLLSGLAIGAGLLNKSSEQLTPKSLGPVIWPYCEGNFWCPGVHESVGMAFCGPKAEPRAAAPHSMLFGDDSTISRPSPACEEVRELSVAEEAGERWTLGLRIPKERLKEHILQEIQIRCVTWSKLYHMRLMQSSNVLAITCGPRSEP